MKAGEIASLVVALFTIMAFFMGSIRWLVKHYLSELKTNHGGTMKDQLARLEARVDTILIMLRKS